MEAVRAGLIFLASFSGCGHDPADAVEVDVSKVTSLSGFVSIGHHRQPGTKNFSDEDIFFGEVLFVPETPATNAPDPHYTAASGVAVADFFYPIEVGSCAPVPKRDEPEHWLDAGPAATVTVPWGRVVTLDRLGWSLGSEIFYNGFTASGVYEAEYSYPVSVPGGPERGKVSLSLTAPADLSLTAPDFSGEIHLPRGADLELSWIPDSSPRQSVIIVALSEGLLTADQVCRFADDGHATIPAATLSIAMGADTNDVMVNVARGRLAAFVFPDAPTPVVGVAQSLVNQVLIFD